MSKFIVGLLTGFCVMSLDVQAANTDATKDQRFRRSFHSILDTDADATKDQEFLRLIHSITNTDAATDAIAKPITSKMKLEDISQAKPVEIKYILPEWPAFSFQDLVLQELPSSRIRHLNRPEPPRFNSNFCLLGADEEAIRSMFP